jgi:hypothetical protein
MADHIDSRYRRVISALSDLLTREMRAEILSGQGVSPANAIEISNRGNDAFFETLESLGKFTRSNMNIDVFDQYKGLQEIIQRK